MVTDQDGRHRLEGDLEHRMHAIMDSVNWVCEDLFKEEHESVTCQAYLGELGVQSWHALYDAVGFLWFT